MRLRLDRANFSGCPQFNDWLDEQYTDRCGPLEIMGFQPRPSEVLYRLSPDTYEAAFADFQAEYDDELNELVFDAFPAPIAHYFYRFQKGYENDLQRLHFLRDTWEATVDVLHAMAVGECRFHGVQLADTVAFKHLLTDSVADRLLTIERLMDAATTQGVSLSTAKIVGRKVLEDMQELNRSRNAFSHSAAQSEAQAREWIGECQTDMISALDDLRGLSKCSLLRYLGQTDGMTLKTEVFCGHGATRTIRPLSLSADQARDSGRFFRQGEVLALHDGRLFSIRPLVYFREDPCGHLTRLCIFRNARGDAPNRRLEFEVVGEASRWDEDRKVFKTELDELRALCGLPPD